MATNMTKDDFIKVIAERYNADELEQLAIKGMDKPKANDVTEDAVTPKKKTKLNAEDYPLELAQNGKVVTFGTIRPKDAYLALKAEAENFGGTYDKAEKGFVFKTKANATKFAKIDKVTAEARNEIRATEWGWK